MNKLKEIFSHYYSNQGFVDEYQYFISHEVNANNEVISLEIYDSEYQEFPFIHNIGDFIGEFKQLKYLEIDGLQLPVNLNLNHHWL